MIYAFGPREAGCCAVAALLGGGVRVGFENNRQFPDGSQAADNAALVRVVTEALSPLDLRPETVDACRERAAHAF